MNKNEIAIAVKAYEAGYNQACDDFAKIIIRSHREAFEATMLNAAKAMEENIKKATSNYFDALSKGKEVK